MRPGTPRALHSIPSCEADVETEGDNSQSCNYSPDFSKIESSYPAAKAIASLEYLTVFPTFHAQIECYFFPQLICSRAALQYLTPTFHSLKFSCFSQGPHHPLGRSTLLPQPIHSLLVAGVHLLAHHPLLLFPFLLRIQSRFTVAYKAPPQRLHQWLTTDVFPCLVRFRVCVCVVKQINKQKRIKIIIFIIFKCEV